MDKKTKKDFLPKFNENLIKFLNHIDSLNESLPLVMALINLKNASQIKDLNSYIEQKKIVKNKEKIQESLENVSKTEEVFEIKIDDYIIFEELQNKLQVSTLAYKVIPQSFLVSLISQFDSFIGNQIKEIFSLLPEMLNSCDKNINYSKLIEFSDINEAKEYIIEKEVESVLRENHIYYFEWLERKLDIPLRKNLSIWATYVEITERRNLFVHNDGKVSSQYLTVCRKNDINIENAQIGKILDVTPEYFKDAYECLYELSVKLTHVIWRKLLPNTIDVADDKLNDICYNLMRKENFKLSDILLDFATITLKKHFNEATKNVFIINKALSKYLANFKDEAYNIISLKDWSASSNTFKLAVAVLKEEYEDVYSIMRSIGTSNEIPKHAYQIWPLFKVIRNEKLFLETFRDIFSEDYKVIERPKPAMLKLLAMRDKPKKRITKPSR
jgi:hypothetical protein